MNNLSKVMAAFVACVAVAVVACAVYALLGLVAYGIWEYAVRSTWPDLTFIEWWKFSLMGVGLRLIGACFKAGKG